MAHDIASTTRPLNMPTSDRRQAVNADLRAQVERLRVLDHQIKRLSFGLEDQAIQAARGLAATEAAERLNALLQHQVQQLRQVLRSLEKESPASFSHLLSAQEWAALLGEDGPSGE